MILFKTTMKRCLKRPAVLITLLILPIVCMLIDFHWNSSNDARDLNSYTLAISDEDHSAASLALIDKLSQQYNVENVNEHEINTLLTDKNCNWAIVIPRDFQINLLNGHQSLIKSYGFAQQEKWQPVKLNIENMLASMSVMAGSKSPAGFQQNLRIWLNETRALNIGFIKQTAKNSSPGTGLVLYAMIELLGAYLLSRMFVEDKESGMTSRIATSPVKPWRYLLENLACFSVILIVQNVLFLLAYAALNPRAVSHPAALLFAFMLYSVMSVGLMLTMSTLCRSSFVMLCASTISIMLLSMLGGLFMPISIMPDTLKQVAMITPTYWFTNALDSLYSGNSGFAFQLAILAGFALVFYLAGSWKKYSKLD